MEPNPTVAHTLGPGPTGGSTRIGDETLPMMRNEDEPTLTRGTLVDRYVVVDQLGAGGMGVVYAAYDPELDRRVAIKLLHPSLLGEGRSRLMREAQAIARLAHPNVVAVHDVGNLDGSVFVAMEFIDGQTLGRWLRDGERSLAEILGVFRQAGQGVAAAHAADLVHRDFKPDNVLVGVDGRVRVLDFGLARGRGSAESLGYGDGLSVSNLDEALTEVGTVMGTPAYMSPEQLAGRMATAQSDQFAFCVALHEALYGLRPFEGKTIQSLSKEVYAGHIREPPPGRSIPYWLRRVILQGLQTAPRDRHASMEALLAALVYDPGRRRRHAITIASVGAGAVTLAALAYTSGASRDRSPCYAAADEINAIWSDERREQLGAAMRATELPYAEDTWTRVSERLDDYAKGWREQSVAACEATHLDQTQSTQMLERRRRCLGERLQRLDAFLDVLAQPEPVVVDHAVQSVLGLPDLEGCRDLAALQAGVAPPEQESIRLAVQQLRDDLAHIEALSSGNRYQQQIDALQPMLEEARATGYLPVIAAVEHSLSRAQRSLDLEEGIPNLRAAFRDALAAGDDRLAAMAAVDLAHVLGHDQRLHERGRQWVDIAQALVTRLGGAPRIEVGMTNTLAIIAIRQARRDEALALFEQLYEKQRALDPDSPNVAVALMNLGSAHAERRDLDLARDYLTQALEHNERVLGPKHPSNTTIYTNLGAIALLQGQYEQAEAHLEHTLALQEELLGTDNLEYAGSLATMAIAQRNLGHRAESERLHRRALETRRRKLEPDHPEIAESIRNLALTVVEQGRPKEALELALEAQRISSKRLEEDHPEHGTHAAMVAYMMIENGQAADALVEANRAIEILDARGHGPTASVDARGVKGRAERALGRITASRATLEEALQIAEGGDVGGKLGKLRFELAQTLALLGEDDEALRLAHLARTRLDESGAGFQRDRERVDRWLSARSDPAPTTP